MSRQFTFTIMLFALFDAFSLQAQDTSYLSLNSIFRKIETSYPEILSYANRIRSLQERTRGAKAWMAPTLAVGLDQFPYKASMVKEEGPENQAALMFTVEQMIPNPARLNARQGYFNSLADIERNNSEWVKNTLRASAKQLYYQRYSAERKLKIVQESKELLNLLITTAEEKYTYNQSDLSTIYKAKAKLEELSNMESMLLAMVAESNIGLNVLMNRDIYTPFTIDTLIVPKEYDGSAAPDTTVLTRSDIVSMENQISSMQLSKKLMSLESRPDFGIQFTHMQMFGMHESFSLMGMMTLPIVPWSSKMYRSEVKYMENQILAMQRDVQTMRLMAQRMIAEKLTMLKYGKSQLRNYEQNIIPAFRKNFDVSLLAYRQNTGNFFVLVDSWEMLLMKQMEYYDKLYSVLKLEAEYEFEIEKAL
ncbi:MAG TPA: TolC family protein [Chitinophagales bacterium]|nr:TolC family protein [Chitinophagales bacterium]